MMDSRQVVGKKFQTPGDFTKYLKRTDLTLGKIHLCMESLRVALTNNRLDWVREFGEEGLSLVLDHLKNCLDQ